MSAPIAARMARLERDVAAFHARVNKVGAALPPEPPRDPTTLARVHPLYEAAERLRLRAEDIAQDMGVPDFFNEPVVQARRGAALVLDSAHLAARTVTQVTRVGLEGHAPTTVSVTPGSAASAQRWEQARAGRDIPDVRIVGSVPQPAANLLADRLENVPGGVVQLTDRLGIRGALFSGKLTDVWGYRRLRGEHPRGWPDGATWDTVPGAGGTSGYAANPNRELTGRGHSSSSLALHEYAHAVDHATARPGWRRASVERPWRDGPWRELRRRTEVSAYLRNHAEEWYAEAFARYTRSPQSQAALARWYPETWRYFRSRMGEQQFG